MCLAQLSQPPHPRRDTSQGEYSGVAPLSPDPTERVGRGTPGSSISGRQLHPGAPQGLRHQDRRQQLG